MRTEPALIEPRQPKGARRMARALARRGVARLLAAVEETTHGSRFRAAESGIAEGQAAFPADLYDGAAGVALALTDAHAAFGSARCRAAVEQVGDGLRESAPTAAPREPQGLYMGLGGRVLLQLRRARQWGDAGAGAEATRLGVLLREAPIQDADLLYGAAGTGLVHLAIHHAAGHAGDRAPLEAARRCVEYLRRAAVTVDGGLGWPFGNPGERVGAGRPRPAPPLYTGFAHGTAGIAVFLLAAARSMPGDPLPRRLAAGAFRRLDRTAVWRGQTVAWPVSNVDRRRRYHWCHGTTGIAQAYLARYRHAGDAEALRIARAAGLHTWGALCAAGAGPRDKYPCHCHGLGGALELFMDLHEQGAGGEWLHRAAAIGRRLAVLAGPGRGPSALGGDGCGLAYGTAGILRALLRLAGHAAPAPWALDRSRVAGIPSVAPRSPVPAFLRRGGGARRGRRRGATPPRARSRLRPGPGIVPPIGARIHGVQRVALLGPEWGKAATRFARRFLAAPESEPLHRAARTVERATRALRSRHADLLGPDALGLATHGRFLREVAGLALYGGAAATPHRARAAERAARRYTGALALCLA
ncbi:MAG TPA: lanthionine synthetase LanC family protein, partial [Candidatus Limnocylindrales bacterium]|nr:lanthionine synthetase LanC family protein [Candidatus Limnocylindrales bacterium]